MFILHTAWKDLRRILRDPLGLLLWMGIPLAIGGMVKLAFGAGGDTKSPQAEVLVADQDDSFLSGLLLGAMGQQQGGRLPFVAEAVTLEDGRERIEDGDGTALLVIPAGFAHALVNDEPCTLELVTNPAQRILPGMVEESLELLVDGVFYLHRVFGDVVQEIATEPPPGANTKPDADVARISVTINRIMDRISALVFPPAIELVIDVESEGEETPGGFGELFFPSMLFMMLFFMASGVSEDIWVEKQMGTLRRAIATPNRVSLFLGGKVLANTLLVTAVGALGLLIGRFVFGLALANPLLAVLWTAVSGALFILLLVPLQLLASSQRTGNIVTNMVMMPLLMLGGSFFPFEVMPDWMAGVGRMTPNGWALSRFKAIVGSDVLDLGVLALSFGGLTLVGVLLFLFSARRMAGAFARS